MSREVQFEYTTVPDMVVFSEWGARQLDVSEILVEPCHNPELNRVIGKENLLDLERRLGKTTPESPIIEHNYLLNIRGQYRWCCLLYTSRCV